MRLINSTTLQLEEFVPNLIPEYVILSHTWGEEEVSFKDMQGPLAENMKGFAKIKNCCARAARDGFKYAWVDTCCIDKSSSAELSEAINSMYEWYKNARICYAYLEDVSLTLGRLDWLDFRQSRWFTRGWTLQELVAPSIVEFYDVNWTEVGTKLSLQEELSHITGIDISVLRGDEPWSCNVAQRMSWASRRCTTRPEDMAYCLMGIFDVKMPLLYGEGEELAFTRLQEEIMKGTEDYTLFAWLAQYPQASGTYRGLLARSPREFGNPDGHLRRTWKYSELIASSPVKFGTLPGFVMRGQRQTLWEGPPILTSRGLRIRLPVSRNSAVDNLACLYCLKEQNEMLCITLRKLPNNRELYGRVLAHEVTFLPTNMIGNFDYSTIYVTRSTSDFLDNRLLGPHECDLQVFEIQFSSDTANGLSVCEIFPKVPLEDKYGSIGDGFILHELTHRATKVLKICGSDLETFFAVVGVLEKDIPWCDVVTEDELRGSGNGTAEGVYNSCSWNDYAGITDRVTKSLESGKLVTATMRPAPYIYIGNQGKPLRRYNLTICLKP
jgi:hypothetical protein